MSASIFNGSSVKLLKDILKFKSGILIITDDTDDPTVVAKSAPIGSLYIRSGTDDVYVKGDNGSSTNWSQLGAGGSGITELTGDVTAGPGSGSQAATIANDSVSNGKLANMATQTIKGRTTAGTGDPEDLTASQATAILNNMVGDSGAGGTKGLVPAPAAGDAAAGRFLRADATWAIPSSLVDWSPTAVKVANYTAAVGEFVLVDPSGGAFTVTLPTAVGNDGKRIAIKVSHATTTWHLAATVDGNASETIDGATTFPLYTPGEELEIVSDGTNWRINNHRIAENYTSGTYTPSAVTVNPTLTTGVDYNVREFWREGAYLCYKYTLKTTNGGGSNGTGDYLFVLPNSLTMHSNVQTGTITSGLFRGGTFLADGIYANAAILNNAPLYGFKYDSTRMFFLIRSSNVTLSSSNNGLNAGGGNSVMLSFDAKIRIDGWQG